MRTPFVVVYALLAVSSLSPIAAAPLPFPEEHEHSQGQHVHRSLERRIALLPFLAKATQAVAIGAASGLAWSFSMEHLVELFGLDKKTVPHAEKDGKDLPSNLTKSHIRDDPMEEGAQGGFTSLGLAAGTESHSQIARRSTELHTRTIGNAVVRYLKYMGLGGLLAGGIGLLVGKTKKTPDENELNSPVEREHKIVARSFGVKLWEGVWTSTAMVLGALGVASFAKDTEVGKDLLGKDFAWDALFGHTLAPGVERRDKTLEHSAQRRDGESSHLVKRWTLAGLLTAGLGLFTSYKVSQLYDANLSEKNIKEEKARANKAASLPSTPAKRSQLWELD